MVPLYKVTGGREIKLDGFVSLWMAEGLPARSVSEISEMLIATSFLWCG